MIFLTIYLLLFLLALNWCKNNLKYYILAAKLQKPPGFSSHPILGHTKYYLNPKELFKLVKSFTSPYGVSYFGPKVYYYINDADLAEEVLKSDKCVNKAEYLDFSGPFGESLSLAEDNNLFRHRKLARPMFSNRMVKYYIACSEHREELVNDLSKYVGHDVNVLSTLQKFAHVQFFDCMLGIDGAKWYDKYIPKYKEYVSESNKFVTRILRNSPLYKSTNQYRASKNLFKVTKEMLEDRRLMKTQNDTSEIGEMIFSDYLIHCLDTGTLSERECLNGIMMLIVAGADSTQMIISNILVCLAINQDIQDKVYQEIINALDDRVFQPSDYRKLTYLEMVLKETLRVCGTAGNVAKSPREDMKIGDNVFPKGSNIHINLISMHNNPKYFKNPSEFIPERFAPDSEEEKARHRYAYLPFSAGKRACLGETYAKLNIFSTITSLLRKYRFESSFKRVSDIPVLYTFTTSFMNGYDVKIYNRSAKI